MKKPLLQSLLILLVGLSLTLTACQYPYACNGSGPYRGTFTPYHTTGRGPLGALTASPLAPTVTTTAM
ncbi:MAG: hypothetical protein ACYC67_21105 [Prosthecobacter sp.]